MEQHPVPQPITSYEFRLVGDMTLRQFAKLASGVILALIVYGIDPPSLVKWFLIFLFAGLGAAMAFIPFEGRPIDTWIIAFFKRIYSPTQYIWRPKPQITRLPKPGTGGQANNKPQVPDIIQPSIPPVSPAPTPASAPDLTTLFKAEPAKEKTVEAKYVPNVIIPATPSIPNILVGLTHKPDGKIIEGAILEIRDTAGNPVRALKSNKLGQFQIATPLPSGSYEIEIEKNGIRFDIIKIELKGEIVPPIEIISKN